MKRYKSGEEYLKMHQEYPDIFLLDIQLGKMNGMEIARKLRKEGYKGDFIFVTAFREYVFEGYEVKALNYLLKPVKERELFLCLDEVAIAREASCYIFPTKQETVQLPYNKIFSFSSSLHYVDILSDTGIYRQSVSLSEIEKVLPSVFIRVHRSYIVNMGHIYKISGLDITLSNHTHVPIGRKYYKAVCQAFKEYSMRLSG